jgi:hypothetical protein
MRSHLRRREHQRESRQIEKQEGNEQLVDLADQEADKPFIRFKEDARDEEIKRYTKT